MGNPFNYLQFATGDQFYDRLEIRRDLRSRFLSGQANVVLYGPRRYGKSSLVAEVVGDLEKAGIPCVTLDVVKVPSLDMFVSAYATKVYRRLAPVKFEFKKLGTFLKSLRPKMTLGPTGEAGLSFEPSDAPIGPEALTEVLDLPQRLLSGKGRAVVVFDEFQDMLKLDNAMGILAEMRGSIQFQEKTPFFFTGSVRNEMMRIFDDMESPFYKSALPFAVDAINPVTFGRFIADRFEKGKRKIGAPVISSIIDFADGVSGDVQELCEALWETTETGDEITADGFAAAFELIFSRELGGYETIIERLTPGQTAVLRGMAENPGALIYSGDFASRVGMPTSSIRRVVGRLSADRIVFLRNGKYHFSNPFFREWLKRN